MADFGPVDDDPFSGNKLRDGVVQPKPSPSKFLLGTSQITRSLSQENLRQIPLIICIVADAPPPQAATSGTMGLPSSAPRAAGPFDRERYLSSLGTDSVVRIQTPRMPARAHEQIHR